MNDRSRAEADPRAAPTAAALFARLWSELVAVLGTAATATLVRRAAKHACGRHATLEGLRVVRDGWEYRYELPPAWNARTSAQAPELLELVGSELAPLLREFTGQIVVRRLAGVPGLEALGLAESEER